MPLAGVKFGSKRRQNLIERLATEESLQLAGDERFQVEACGRGFFFEACFCFR